MKFDKLIKDKRIASHPLLAGYSSWEEENWDEADELTDIFSDMGKPYGKKSRDLRSVVADATYAVQDAFAMFDLPSFPEVRFLNNRDTRYASQDQIESSTLDFSVTFRTATNVKRVATVPVTVIDGEVTPPSVMEIDNVVSVISAHAVEDMLDNATSYVLPPVREGYEPPLRKDERALATEVRNDTGWRPNTSNFKNYMSRKNQSKAPANVKLAEFWRSDDEAPINIPENIEAIKENLQDFAQGYDFTIKGIDVIDTDEVIVTTSEESTEIKLTSTPSEVTAELMDVELGQEPLVMETQVVLTLDQLDNTDYEDLYERQYPVRGKRAARTAPSAYAAVKELLEDAEKNGTDTFPRPWVHLLRNYILNVVNTASQDAWMPHLINEGFCLNPYGQNLRTRKASTLQELDRYKRAQQMEKEIEMEVVDEPVKPSRFYRDTKTPIELEDGVRFGEPKNRTRGVIVEIDDTNDYLIIKSKGMEYRVEVDAVDPLPSTFKKMYK